MPQDIALSQLLAEKLAEQSIMITELVEKLNPSIAVSIDLITTLKYSAKLLQTEKR